MDMSRVAQKQHTHLDLMNDIAEEGGIGRASEILQNVCGGWLDRE